MRGLWLVLMLALGGVAQAAIDTYAFGNDTQRERFAALTRELRCPKCQNQDLADSNAPIAADLRREIHRLLLEGKSDREVVDYLVARYGEFVRYKPAFEARTWLLWLGPAGLLLVGAGVGWLLLRRRHAEAMPATLDAGEQARLAALLKSRDDD
ncbi:cytochrome c-type biogenesis protein [Pseudomonas sp. RIT-PI-S]|uniref:cytochrome c-type biogenesis protein n=1 Tax=Pseudomonas sp. RIT-PI-S TaxID=3035295 RepID=UPI0021D9CC2A|nr:cytochrome c-type biogenesis protein [Pseudomonas sp. RIT-PI-S]